MKVCNDSQIISLDHTYYLRRLVEEAGTTTTIQEVMILLNAALSELLREIVAVGGQRVRTSVQGECSCLFISLKFKQC